MVSSAVMKMPLGRPYWVHWARKVPSWSKSWMRLFERSATTDVFQENVGVLNSRAAYSASHVSPAWPPMFSQREK